MNEPMNEPMRDPLIRLAGRTLGLLPVLQPRLLSMFAAEEAVDDGEGVESDSVPNSGLPYANLYPNSYANLYPNSSLNLAQPWRSAPQHPILGEPNPVDPILQVFNQSSSPLASISDGVGVVTDRPSIEVQTTVSAAVSPVASPVVSPLVPIDRPTLPFTRLPRSLMRSIGETRIEGRSFERSVDSEGSIPLTPLERGDRKEQDLRQDLAFVTSQDSISFMPDSLESLSLKIGKDESERPFEASFEEFTTASVPIALPTVETFSDAVGEPIGESISESIDRVQPHPEMNSAANRQNLSRLVENQQAENKIEPERSVEQSNPLVSSPGAGTPLNPLQSGNRREDDLEQALEFANSSVPIAQPTLETFRMVGASIGLAQPNPEMDSSANRQNPSNQFENKIIRNPQSVSTDLRDETRNSFQGGPEPQQNASLDAENFPPQPFANNSLDERTQDLEFVMVQNSMSLSAHPSGSLVPRKYDDRPQPPLELEVRTTPNSLALPPETRIASTPTEKLENTIGEPIAIVQPRPEINSADHRQNLSKQIDNTRISPQIVSTDLRDEPQKSFSQKSFQDGPETQQNVQNSITISPSESLILRKQDDRSPRQQASELKPQTDPVPLALPAETAISSIPTSIPSQTLKDAIIESIAIVQPNPIIGGPETQQTTSDLPLISPTPLKVPLPKGDLGGSGLKTTIAITIGRISVRGIPPAAPPPSRSTRSNRPQVSLNDYLKARNGGNG